ncbi:mevalonate kinase [Nocardia arthritidis]|uniref:mevalonate kinase n=1 Tax=Nocardia arthritidis TaxID=228602 RepID=A0A6G9Y6S7_9NOCA|nr:mevalonate kinase [Nocardia arthritidis]QIS08787.1 mevalonate kinase [Nocardia arthritidis]
MPADKPLPTALPHGGEIGRCGIGAAHGKVIVAGEHTVVHGTPAIAIPLTAVTVEVSVHPACDRCDAPEDAPAALDAGAGFECRFTVDGSTHEVHGLRGAATAVRAAWGKWGMVGTAMDVVVRCGIPPGRGLGSSAACTTAVLRAMADLYSRPIDPDTLYEWVQRGEHLAHGRASGVDARAVLASTPIWFQQGAARPIEIAVAARWVIADSGHGADTRTAVAWVRDVLDHDPARAQRLLARATALVEAASADLAAGRLTALGRGLVDCQGLLSELGVSTPVLDHLIAAALDAGALGAKLTGGGLGGCVIALAGPGPQAPAELAAALRAAGAARTWCVTGGGDCW